MITLDYAEITGLHVRVGLIDVDGITDDMSDLESVANDLVSGLGACWDVSRTSATTIELSFERGME